MVISGIFWFPLCLLMGYLFFEQYRYRRFPQYLIILCLALSSCCRCIWFLSYQDHGNYLAAAVLNRLAILLQFTAVSLLLMMWSRVLKVSHKSISNMTELTVAKASSECGPPQTVIIMPPSTIPHSKSELGLLSQSTPSNWYLRATVVVNMIVWIFILVTISLAEADISKDYQFYNLNMTLLAGLCFFEGLIILVVGVHTGLRISRELSPIFLSWRAGAQQVQKTKCTKLYEFFIELYLLFFTETSNRSHRLHGQAQAVQKLVLISTVIAVFFLLRSFLFLYQTYFRP
jgi:hypothetical protein